MNRDHPPEVEARLRPHSFSQMGSRHPNIRHPETIPRHSLMKSGTSQLNHVDDAFSARPETFGKFDFCSGISIP